MANTLITENIAVDCEDSGVAWSAIIGGTLAAFAFTLLLMPLGGALGFASSPSPWHDMDSTEKTVTVVGAIWLIVVQWVSSGVGGYLTGRLRTAWPGAHTHEVFFRDTAHGFLTWALASVVGLLFLTGGLLHAAHHAPPMHDMGPVGHSVNKLFRIEQGTASPAVTEQDRADSAMILTEAGSDKGIPESDKTYLTHLVSARTGLSEPVARARVDTVVSETEESMKEAHKNMAITSLFLFFSMWIGAFIAAAAGALGGLHRDTHYRTGRLSE